MPVTLFEDQGLTRIDIIGELSPGDAHEVRVLGSDANLRAQMGGLEAPVSAELAERLLAAGARDGRGN